MTEYVERALRRAHYDIIDDTDEPFFADLKGVWAAGKTLEDCRSNLKDVVEGWILISVKQSLPS